MPELTLAGSYEMKYKVTPSWKDYKEARNPVTGTMIEQTRSRQFASTLLRRRTKLSANQKYLGQGPVQTITIQ